MQLDFETRGVCDSTGHLEIATPQHICDDMASLFDFTDCERKIWADLYCKTGNTLIALKKHGVPEENILAICPSKQCQMFAARKLYGYLPDEVEVPIAEKYTGLKTVILTRRGQVYCIGNQVGEDDNPGSYIYNMRYNNEKVKETIENAIYNEARKTMKNWDSKEDFKINNIIMNPPYNNDIYIDFVTLAHDLAKDAVVAITPAKWQAKRGQKNEDFREGIVPYMSKIVYYPEETDVFDVRSACGISYYLIDKNIHKEKYIYNISNRVKAFNTGLQIREYNELDTLYNIGNTIVKKLGNTGVNLLSNDTSKRYKVALNTQVLYWGSSKTHCFFSPDGKSQVISNCKIFDSTSDKKLEVSAADYVFSTDNVNEVEYFKSWVDTKFIRFLVLIGFNVLTGVLNPEFWRFVPAPEAFDHIFTDEELYKKYSLTDEEINIIESVIKERN